MKRVRVISTAVPAALGLVIPAAAYPAITHHHPIPRSHPVRPDTASRCGSDPDYLGHGISCLEVIGTSNFVNTMYARYWSSPGTAYVGYKDVAGHPAKSKWRASPFSQSPDFFWWHKWGPGCSFPTGTELYAYANYHYNAQIKDATNITVHGSDFTGRHACA